MDVTERFGHVKLMKPESGFGFIRSSNEDFYFKLSQAKNQLRIGEPVAFLLIESKGKQEATSVRRIFTNAFQIRFISRAKSHLHEGVEDYLSYISNEIKNYDEEYIVKQIDFPKPIGISNCVQTYETDQVYFAIREKRLGHSRFVLNREAETTNSITLVLKRADNYYLIITSYLGKKSGVEPYDERATDQDLAYWSTHAFIHGSEPVIENNTTLVNPWILKMPAMCNLTSKK
jgi:cold shock CspA family protein